MKKAKQWWLMGSVLLSVFLWCAGAAVAQEEDNHTLSPYFFVLSEDAAADRMPLKKTSASVHIAGVIADVTVTQVYKNEGRRPLEAVYVFPASIRAAVYGMKMTIGKRVIEAEISRRDAARKIYEQARDAGKNASLLEQQRPNVFQMNVANIMPGDEIQVELKYTEMMIPTDRVYEFVYPTVVGPRYARSKAQATQGDEGWAANPYLRQGELSATTFDIRVAIEAGMPLKEVRCASHKVKADFISPSEVRVTLDKTEVNGGNRDYILRYRLAGEQISGGLLLSQGEKENFFVLMMQPPQKITPADIPGREYIFIVDVSGSMHGFPLDITKKLLADLIGNLRSTDRFNVLLFSGSSSLMAEESLLATDANIRRAISVIERQRGGGTTELLPALKRALALKKHAAVSRSIVVVTDGYVTVEEEAFELIRHNLNEANLFAFGIGSSVNRHLIEGMARAGMGEPFVLTDQGMAAAEASRFRKMINEPLLTAVKVRYEGFDVYDVEPVTIPDVLAERPVIVFGKWKGRPSGKITISGISGAKRYEETLHVKNHQPSRENAALRYLWARHRIALLSDYNSLRHDSRRVEEVTELGLKYHLLTAYTSFVAVDSDVRNIDGQWTRVKQPLPLPHGVTNLAVGDMAGSPVSLSGSVRRVKTKHSEYVDLSGGSAEGDKKEVFEKIQILSVTVSKGLSREQILRAAREHANDIEQCAGNKSIARPVILNLTINPDGTVKKAAIASGTILDKKIRQCILAKVVTWRFPAFSSVKEVKVSIAIDMSSD
ncbi:MAG: VIT domain-containing protein [Smithellaceae bacterium]